MTELKKIQIKLDNAIKKANVENDCLEHAQKEYYKWIDLVGYVSESLQREIDIRKAAMEYLTAEIKRLKIKVRILRMEDEQNEFPFER